MGGAAGRKRGQQLTEKEIELEDEVRDKGQGAPVNCDAAAALVLCLPCLSIPG